jgi:SAM-dependent methyltransferase
MFGTIAKDHGQSGKAILVIGCGNQEAQLARFFVGDDTAFVFCDIDKGASADVFCDAHELPFKSGSFDGIISTAVMEHVIRPDQVAEEMHRVLKKDGFVYSEIPFLQGVHEGAYDFTRYSLSGHRRLYEKFEEIDTGMVAGPGTNLTWQIVDFAKLLSQNTRISSGLALIARTLFFWIKYTDYIFQRNPKALDAASCTYFYGKRRQQACAPSDIIARYGVSNFSHT